MAIIALENIKILADGSQMHHVLSQQFSVRPNEFVAILGPSGSW